MRRGKNDAAGQSGALTPPVTSPQSPGTTRPAGKPAANLAAPQDATADTTQQTGDDLGASSDPLVGKGRPGVAPGTEEVPLGTKPAQVATPAQTASPVAPRPAAVASLGNAATNPQANAQYKAGYDAIVKGNYSFAADQFRQFIQAYPADPQAADATNWLGEALAAATGLRQRRRRAGDRLQDLSRLAARPGHAAEARHCVGRSAAAGRRLQDFWPVGAEISEHHHRLQDAAEAGNGARQVRRLSDDAELWALFAAAAGVEAIGLAVSGGADSLALMLLASRWARSTPTAPRIFVYSVDHGLRPEAEAEAAFVMHEAARLGLAGRTLRWAGAKHRKGCRKRPGRRAIG